MRRLLYVVITVAFIDTFIQFPIITPYAMSLGATETFAGVIVAVYSLSNMFGNIVGGQIIDRMGSKRVLLFGMMFVAIILMFYPLSRTPEHLFVVRLVHGLAGGVLVPAAFALLGNVGSHQRGGKKMAFAGAAIGIAAILGPALGGTIASLVSVETVFWLVAGLFLVTIMIVWNWIPEMKITRDRGSMHSKDFIPLLKHPILTLASCTAFIFMLSNGTLVVSLPLLVEDIGQMSSFTGVLLSTYGIVALIFFATPLNKVYVQQRPEYLIMAGFSLIGLSLVLLFMVHTLWAAILAMVVYGSGFALVFPSANQLVAKHSHEADRGKAYGLFYAFFSIGAIAGSSAAGYVTEQMNVYASFLIPGIVMFASASLMNMFVRRRKMHLNET